MVHFVKNREEGKEREREIMNVDGSNFLVMMDGYGGEDVILKKLVF